MWMGVIPGLAYVASLVSLQGALERDPYLIVSYDS